MPGSESYFLKFNQDEIFRDLLAIEGHFRYVTPKKDMGDLSCCVKHLGSIESHALEGQSHALIAKDEETSQKFAELKDKAYELRTKIQHDSISASDGIRTIRKIRGFFESFNPEYDISRCTTCGPMESVHRLEKTLQAQGRNPSWGSNPQESQRFNREKALNYRQINSEVVKPNMVKRNEVLGIYGSELIAKAGERIFIEVDKATGKLVAPLYARPSFWINMGLGIGIPLVTLMRKANSKWALPAVAAGGHFFSKVVDYAEEIVSPITARVAAAAERVVYKPPATDGNQRVHTRMPTVSVGVSASYDATPFI